ncbi:hypothetical protein D3C80_1577660 [compost metagenome]
MLSDDVRQATFERAKEIRNRQKLRAVKDGVDRIVLKFQDGLSRNSALSEALEIRKLVDEALGTSTN